MISRLDCAWFLDSECCTVRRGGDAVSSRPLNQPWREFWPPNSGTELHLWLQSEYPEVLYWRFDPTRPFDRPWRTWTSSARAKRERELEVLQIYSDATLSQSATGRIPLTQVPNLTNGASSFSTPASFGHKNDRQSALTVGLDQQLNGLNLPSVTPDSFHYVAPLEIYGFEKPYLSRLPCIAGLKRTNIVAKKHCIQIFEISGHEAFFTLDKAGFEFAKSPIAMQEWTSSSVRTDYVPSLQTWVKQYLRCTEVIVYAYNVSPYILTRSKERHRRTYAKRLSSVAKSETGRQKSLGKLRSSEHIAVC